MSESAFLILFLAVIACMGIVPFLLRRFNIPAVISLLLVGILIGPTGIGFDLVGVLSRALSFLGDPNAADTAAHTQRHFMSFIDSLGALGLMLLMALAGMEADFKLIRSTRKPVIALSVLTFIVPAAVGYFIYWCFCPKDLPGKLLYASLFASHSVGIVFPVVRELKLTRTRFGAAVLISTVITDIASIILLAVSLQLFRQQEGVSHMVGRSTLSIFDHVDSALLGNTFLPVFLLIVLLYMAAALFCVNRIGLWLMRRFHPGEDMLIMIFMLLILVAVLVGEVFGINLVVGAFIAGLGLAKVVSDKSRRLLFKRFESIGYGFVIPFLFVSIGMKTNFRVFYTSDGQSWKIVLFTVLGLVASKMLSGWLAMKFSGFSNGHGFVAGLMTVPQLSATLAAAAIGKSQGVLNETFFNAIVILSVVTTLPIPTSVRFAINRLKLTFHEAPYKIPEVVKDEELL
jgi:Kef-type K+ transport system membrane component KefB